MRHARRTALISATALLSLSAALLAPSAPASAGLTLPTGHGTPKIMRTLGSVVPTENRLPLIGGAPVGLPLEYGGGAVELTNKNYAVFWGPAGSIPSGYQSLVSRFFGDVGGSALFDTTTEYYQNSGSAADTIKNISTYGGAITDTSPYPAGGITDAALQAEVTKLITTGGYPAGAEYFIYTAPPSSGGETVASYCAYHSYVTVAGKNTPYADEPYGGQSGCTVPASPNGNAAADSIINTTSHELWETITDPNTGDGWVALDGDEGSDQCNFEFGTQDASGADVHMNGHPYIVQQEWRNSAAPFGCVMS